MTSSLQTLRDALPEGVPVPVRWLHDRGISSALVQVYLRSGWLEALPGAAYRRPGPPGEWSAALYAAQQLGLPVHIGHLSALNLQGLSHSLALGEQAPLHLYLHARTPTWLQALPQARWHHEQVVSEAVEAERLSPPTLRSMVVSDPPLPAARKLGVTLVRRAPWPVYASTPERAALELAAGLTRGGSWDAAYETFGGLSLLSPALVRTLLLACTSAVTRRLFLHLAGSGGHAWFPHLDLAGIDLGTGDRQVVPGGRLDPLWRITVPRTVVR